jgi:hypothetical protein
MGVEVEVEVEGSGGGEEGEKKAGRRRGECDSFEQKCESYTSNTCTFLWNEHTDTYQRLSFICSG